VLTHLERVLGHPTTCPHGNPIPSARGEIVEDHSHPLTQLHQGDKGIVAKIEHEDPEVLRYLATLNLKPRVSIEVIDRAPFHGPLTLHIAGTTHAISHTLAEKIRIRTDA
jgi:DtxR family Mn-dependent transcriptional regulator